jgi:hypothetical protein
MKRDGVDYAELAKQAAGNWRKFESFGWHDRPDDADGWAIVYTNNRDSGLVDESNAKAIAKAMQPYLEAEDPDVLPEHHGHWACGWVDGYSIRVYDGRGEPTEAFKAWCDLHARLEDYPLLDEEDYSSREYEATLENISEELHYLNRNDEYSFPDDAAEQLYGWLWDNNQRAIENQDDRGGCPSREELAEACDALGWRILYVVHYNDSGDTTEEYDLEEEAAERVLELRLQGAVEAAYGPE